MMMRKQDLGAPEHSEESYFNKELAESHNGNHFKNGTIQGRIFVSLPASRIAQYGQSKLFGVQYLGPVPHEAFLTVWVRDMVTKQII